MSPGAPPPARDGGGPPDAAPRRQHPLRGPHRTPGFLLLASLPGVALALLVLWPPGAALVRVPLVDVALVLLANGAAIATATALDRRRHRGPGAERAYRVAAAAEALVVPSMALWVVYRGGRADSPLLLVYVAFAAINVRYSRFEPVVRALLALPPLLLAGLYLGLRGDLPSALLSLVAGAFGLLVHVAGSRANARLQLVLQEREALEARLSALRLHEERTRIARELHDGLGAGLSSMLWHAELIRARVPAEEGRQIGALIERAGAGIEELRAVVWALRSPSTTWEALAGFVRERVEELGAGGPRLDFQAAPGDQVLGRELPGELAIDVVRAAQEAVRNAVRHAGAALVRVSLSTDGASVTLRVEDDGRGLPAGVLSRDRGGLRHLAERARLRDGDLRIERAAPGTRIVLTLPWPVGQAAPLDRQAG